MSTLLQFAVQQDSLPVTSFLKARWVMPDVRFDDLQRLAQRFNLAEPIARILCARGISENDIPRFLNPTLRDDLPDPFSLAGMKEAAADLARWIMEGRRMAIFADFDVDGATSAAVLTRFLKHCGITPRLYIPERLTEGYGPNSAAMQTLKEEGAEIVWMLDCGTTGFEALAAGKKLGLEIVVLDHHEAEDQLPDAAHIINPKRKDDTSGLTMLAAVGVTFMTCIAVNAALRANGFYNAPVDKSVDKHEGGSVERSEPSLKDWLDLVALGTVCDMVPLTQVNRLLVRQGFQVMNNTKNNGLIALAEISRIHPPHDPYHAGFVLGPRINAGSRVHRSDLGAQLLCLDDMEEARQIAFTLEDCNTRRKDIQAAMERAAMIKAEAAANENQAVIVVESEDFHQGLSGLVAGRLKDHYGRPACVIAYTEGVDGVREARGSARSIAGIHIAQALIEARQAGLLLKGGGHAMAGGFTLVPQQIPAFTAFMNANVQAQMETLEREGRSLIETRIDSLVTVQGIRADLVKALQAQIGPFGQENPEPLFLLRNVRLHSVDVLSGGHVRALISDWEGGVRLKAMAFRTANTPLGEALLTQGRRGFDIVGMLKLNLWQGQERVEIHIKDAAFAG